MELAVAILMIIFIWFSILALGALTLLALAALFGRNAYPPGVPNRAVWG